MAWIYLIIAGIFEIVWVVGLRYCESLKVNIGLIIVIISMALSIFFLSLTMENIPMGISYTIWSGIGIIGVVLYDILVFNEPVSAIKVLFLGIILIGMIGLKLTTNN